MKIRLPGETSVPVVKFCHCCGNKLCDLTIFRQEIDISHKRLVSAEKRYIDVDRLPSVQISVEKFEFSLRLSLMFKFHQFENLIGIV